MVAWSKVLGWRTRVRWKYVGPRLVIVAIIVGFFGLAFDTLVRLGITAGGERLLSARVQIHTLDTSFRRGHVHLQGIAVADPDRALRNMIEIERIDLDLDMQAALRKKLVVHDGHIQGIQFHTSRDEDGRIVDDSLEDEDSDSAFMDNLESRGAAWLEQSLGNLNEELETELETVRVGRELKQRWPAEYDKLERQAKQLELDARAARDRFKQIVDRPLDHLPEIPPAIQQIDGLRRNTLDLQRELTRLQQQVQEDRRAIAAAKQHDVAYVKQRLQLEQLDADSLTQFLLGPVWGARVEMAMHWLRRSREAIPAKPDPMKDRSDGVVVLFPGFAATPDILFRQLRLSGAGTIEGKPYQFSGTLRDLTHQPHRHPSPARLEVTAEGSIQMAAQAIFDRRAGRPVDQFVIDLPAVKQHGQRLGNAKHLAVDLSPGWARIHATIQVIDDQLSGQIRLDQQDLKLTPTLGPKYAKHLSPSSLTSAVSGVHRMTAVVQLSGTVRKPSYQLESNLGPELAVGLRQAIMNELAVKQDQLLATANREVEEELAELQQRLLQKHGKILEQLEIGDTQLEQIKRQLTAGIGNPSDLIGRGRKLLFK